MKPFTKNKNLKEMPREYLLDDVFLSVSEMFDIAHYANRVLKCCLTKCCRPISCRPIYACMLYDAGTYFVAWHMYMSIILYMNVYIRLYAHI